MTRKIGGSLLIIAVIFFSSAAFAEECLEYEPAAVTITGTFEVRTSEKSVDKNAASKDTQNSKYIVFIPETPICVKSKEGSPEIPAEYGINSIQIINKHIGSDVIRTYEIISSRKYEYEVAGNLSRASENHHHTRVVMEYRGGTQVPTAAEIYARKFLVNKNNYETRDTANIDTSEEILRLSGEKYKGCYWWISPKTDVTGTLIHKKFDDLDFWILKPPKPFCVKGWQSHYSEVTVRDVPVFQLDISKDKFDLYKDLINKKVVVRGSFYFPGEKNLLLDVVIKYIESIEPFQKDK